LLANSWLAGWLATPRAPSLLNTILVKYKHIMNLSVILFIIGVLGFVLNRKNIILMLISIEIMLLAITFLILVSSLSFDDILGQTYAIYIITIAGAESAIGLGILVAFYRLRGSIAIEYK
jgi:NADH-ubiquinone oxidoreductase chain 4L